MSIGSGQNPSFVVIQRFVQDLGNLGCDPNVFHAETTLQFLRDDPQQSGGVIKSGFLTFRLDTGARVSTIPEAWLDDKRKLRPFVGNLLGPVLVSTVGGGSSGYMVRAVRVRYLTSTTEYKWDFLVAPGLKEEFGLVSLRDVRGQFNLISDFDYPLPTSGVIDLVPR